MQLENKVAIVTGASLLGIGRAIAIGFAKEGTAVTVDYRSHPDEAQELAIQVASREEEELCCSYSSKVSEKTSYRQPGEKRQPATTSPRRFPADQTPALRFSALLDEEGAPELELALAFSDSR